METIHFILPVDYVGKTIWLLIIFLFLYVLFGRKDLYNYFYTIFDTKASKKNQKIIQRLALLIEAALLFMILFAVWDILLVNKNIKDFGQWGDFFGGILNPILTFLTFIGLMITIVLQQLELKESRKEFKKSAKSLKKQAKHMEIQTFENTFFKMLELHNNIVENLKYKKQIIIPQGTRTVYTGREIFEVLFNEFIEKNRIKPINTYINDIQIKQNHVLGQYFRNLYQILKFINQQEKVLDKDLQDYANILRAQLSSYELIFLFLNCFDGVSDSGQFRDLLIKFSFLQHFPIAKIEKSKDEGMMTDYERLYKNVSNKRVRDYIYTLYLSNGSRFLIGEKALCQFYKLDKSAFDGNNIMLQAECS